MQNQLNKKGFTLIELLIVVVIIGILAAIAIPRFGQTRERAFVSAMQSDLRGTLNAQELYYQATPAGESSPRYEYLTSGSISSGDLGDLGDFGASISPGVQIDLEPNEGNQGFIARAGHNSTDVNCAVYIGDEVTTGVPTDTQPGVIVCGDDVTGPDPSST